MFIDFFINGNIRYDSGCSEIHCLKRRDAEALVERWRDQHFCMRHEAEYLVVVGISHKADAVAVGFHHLDQLLVFGSEVESPDDGQRGRGARLLQQVVGLDKGADALVLFQVAEKHDALAGSVGGVCLGILLQFAADAVGHHHEGRGGGEDGEDAVAGEVRNGKYRARDAQRTPEKPLHKELFGGIRKVVGV